MRARRFQVRSYHPAFLLEVAEVEGFIFYLMVDKGAVVPLCHRHALCQGLDFPPSTGESGARSSEHESKVFLSDVVNLWLGLPRLLLWNQKKES